MIRRTMVLALVLALAAACGGARKESREGKQANAGGEERKEKANGEVTGGEEQAGIAPRGKDPHVPQTPEALLGPEAVTELQRALRQRGLLGAHQQGELDVPTSTALRRFQQQQGLAATGMPDRETLRRLGVSPEQAYGSDHGGKG